MKKILLNTNRNPVLSIVWSTFFEFHLFFLSGTISLLIEIQGIQTFINKFFSCEQTLQNYLVIFNPLNVFHSFSFVMKKLLKPLILQNWLSKKRYSCNTQQIKWEMIFKNCFFITTREVNDDYRIPLEIYRTLMLGIMQFGDFLGKFLKRTLICLIS